MAYASNTETPISAVAALLSRAVSAIATASESIVADRRLAVATLEAKSDDDLGRLGLDRAHIAQDVHRHLFYS